MKYQDVSKTNIPHRAAGGGRANIECRRTCICAKTMQGQMHYRAAGSSRAAPGRPVGMWGSWSPPRARRGDAGMRHWTRQEWGRKPGCYLAGESRSVYNIDVTRSLHLNPGETRNPTSHTGVRAGYVHMLRRKKDGW